MQRALPALILVLAFAAQAAAEDWTEFRGPTGQGHSKETNLPAEFSDTRNVGWKVEVPGEGWSSPVVFKNRVYLTASVPLEDGGVGQSLRVICLNTADGETVWNEEAFQQPQGRFSRIHNKNTHASATPITDGKYLFVHFGTHGTACLTLDGTIVWKTQELIYAPNHGNGGSPVLVDDLLVVNCDGSNVDYVVALDRKTGDIRWKTMRPAVPNPKKFSFSTPLVIEVAGHKQLISAGTDVVIAYEPATGKEIWKVTFDGYSVVPRPVYAHGLVYVCTGWDVPQLLAIKPTGAGDVTSTHVAWSMRRSVSNTPSPLIVGDELYVVSDRGIVTCLNAATGESHWNERIEGAYSASPVYADGKIYFQSEQGETTVIRPGREYQEIARNKFPGERTLASYAVADSALFIRTDRHLYRIQE